MPRELNLNTKLRLSPKDAAYALSISLEKFYMLMRDNVVVSRGGKVLKSEIESVLETVYSPTFPNNVENDKKRDALMIAFCKPGDKLILKTIIGA